jgi:uncharacterized damage-inducible protein DinB
MLPGFGRGHAGITTAFAHPDNATRFAALIRATPRADVVGTGDGSDNWDFDMSLKRTFEELAGYNRWANALVFESALELPDDLYRRKVGVFFGSLHGTLNHLVLTDRLWLTRLTGEGQQPSRLDEILYDDLADLAQARVTEDERIIQLIKGYHEVTFDQIHAYKTTAGKSQEQPLGDILLHVFNHHTHHRGHAHACLSILTGREPPTLDLLAFQRGLPAPDLRSLAANAIISKLA